MRVAVFGLGRVGLPLAVQAAQSGHVVVGVDGHQDVVDSVGHGVVPFPADAELRDQLAALREKSLTTTTDVESTAANTDIAVVAAPLIIDQQNGPGFDAVGVTTIAASFLRPGALVIYETVGAGTDVRARFTSTLERTSGLRVGHNLFAAFSPTHNSLGHSFTEPRRHPDLVVGIDELSTSLAATFYRSVLGHSSFADSPKAHPEMARELLAARRVETVSLAAS